MPPPVDLTGRRFGKLLVIERAAAIVSETGKSHRPAWLCACDCGRQEVMPQQRLPYVPSYAARKDAATCCTHCRSQRICAVCSQPFESLQYRATCSEACNHLHKNAQFRDSFLRKIERQPDWYKTQYAKQTPEAAAAARLGRQAVAARHAKRLAEDPVYREEFNAKMRETYAKNAESRRETVRKRRDKALANMTPTELTAYRAARQQERQATTARKKLAELTQTSAALNKRNDKQ